MSVVIRNTNPGLFLGNCLDSEYSIALILSIFNYGLSKGLGQEFDFVANFGQYWVFGI